MTISLFRTPWSRKPRAPRRATLNLESLEDRNRRAERRARDADARAVDFGPRLQEGHNPIVDFLLCLQHVALIIDQKLLQLRVLKTHVVGDLSIVQDVPLKRRACGITDCSRLPINSLKHFTDLLRAAPHP